MQGLSPMYFTNDTEFETNVKAWPSFYSYHFSTGDYQLRGLPVAISHTMTTLLCLFDAGRLFEARHLYTFCAMLLSLVPRGSNSDWASKNAWYTLLCVQFPINLGEKDILVIFCITVTKKPSNFFNCNNTLPDDMLFECSF